jgi:hypothetical protein
MGRRSLCTIGFLLLALCAAQGEDPCGSAKRRALVLSGGGTKGAFETGAIYHLVVHRHCDFNDFSGTSVGALNAALLAQAAESADASESHANLVAQSEALVSLWQSVKGTRDVVKGRRLATLRFGLFGLEGMNDFQPLRRMLDQKVSPDKLAKGRPVRAGVTSFWDGGYREILAKPGSAANPAMNFLDYLYASSVPPVFGTLPRIPENEQATDPKQWTQFADGSLRHITPIAGYFTACKSDTANTDRNCSPTIAALIPPHEPVQQLFVIVTSPYDHGSDQLPINDPKCCPPERHQMTDGRKILGRTLALLDDAVYRWDLDFMLFANSMLRWRSQAYHNLIVNQPAEQATEAKRQFREMPAFAFESYNRDPQDADAPSLPYDVGVIVPEKEYADVTHLLEFSPARIQEQLYCGCMAADRTMQKDFALASLANRCADRFPPLRKAGKNAGQTGWDAATCQAAPKPAALATKQN